MVLLRESIMKQQLLKEIELGSKNENHYTLYI